MIRLCLTRYRGAGYDHQGVGDGDRRAKSSQGFDDGVIPTGFEGVATLMAVKGWMSKVSQRGGRLTKVSVTLKALSLR